MTYKFQDFSGKRFGRLVVKMDHPEEPRTGTHWYCACDCGTYKSMRATSLISGRAQSCGCLRRERVGEVTRARNNKIERVEQLEGAISDLLRVYNMLMPGVRYIAVQDYALLNDAPIRARRLLDGQIHTG